MQKLDVLNIIIQLKFQNHETIFEVASIIDLHVL